METPLLAQPTEHVCAGEPPILGDHWFCHKCGKPCEVNADAPQNCCARCGSTRIEFIDYTGRSSRTPTVPVRERPHGTPQTHVKPVKPVTVERGHTLFAKLRESL